MIDLSHSQPSPDDPAIVTADTPCRKCQYNLRSLRLVGRCPECGTPVGLSIKGDFLCYSDPDWLQSLRLGVNCTLGAVAVAIVAEFINEPGRSVAGLASTVLFWLGAWFPRRCPIRADWVKTDMARRARSFASRFCSAW